jgi:glycerone phosphate O-acyltransferase
LLFTDFMGMMGIAELLRKAGAFFIRRRFGPDSMYHSLISEYIKIAILSGGHPLEMFIEGTRSRSGKSLYPKIGLLTAIAELVRDREIPDVLILPISMSYDRTLEETLYARELLGQPKPKESTNGLIKGLRWLQSQTYGSMYVNFGEFISIREILGEYDTNGSPYLDSALFTGRVQNLGMKIVLEQQRYLVTPLFSGVATIILAKVSRK